MSRAAGQGVGHAWEGEEGASEGWGEAGWEGGAVWEAGAGVVVASGALPVEGQTTTGLVAAEEEGESVASVRRRDANTRCFVATMNVYGILQIKCTD